MELLKSDSGYYYHETAVIDEGAVIGEGTKIWHFCHIMSGAQIGKNCSLGQNVFIADGAKIGDGCRIGNNVSIFDGVELLDDVFVAPSVVFTNVKRPRANIQIDHVRYSPTLVKQGATIGANATIICGVTIGKYAFVGAGSVVTKDIPDFAMAWVQLAEVHGYVDERGDSR